jgi:hypothetical protein
MEGAGEVRYRRRFPQRRYLLRLVPVALDVLSAVTYRSHAVILHVARSWYKCCVDIPLPLEFDTFDVLQLDTASTV